MSKILANTLGIFVPKFRTVAQYAAIHAETLESLEYSPKQ